MASSTVPTRYWTRLGGGEVRCDVCPRACRLSEGQRGLCFVRACEGGEIVLTSFGRSSGYCVDPIEKKPLSHFLPGTPVLSFGTAGCNLACRFCQNWDISKSREIDTLSDGPPRALAQRRRALCRGRLHLQRSLVLPSTPWRRVGVPRRGHRSVAGTAGYVCPDPRATLPGRDARTWTSRPSVSASPQVCIGGLEPCLRRSLAAHETSVCSRDDAAHPGETTPPRSSRPEPRFADHLGPRRSVALQRLTPPNRSRKRAHAAGDAHARREIAPPTACASLHRNVHDPEGQSTPARLRGRHRPDGY